MPLTRTMIMRGLREITIEVIAADGSFGTPILCDHIKSDSLSEEHASDVQPGGDRQLDVYDKLLGMTGDLVFGKMDLAAKAALTGGTIADTGSTPNQNAKFTRNVADQSPYVRIKGRTAYLGNGETGDALLTIPKAKLTNLSFGRTQDGFTDLSCNIRAIGDSNGDVYTLEKRETAADLSTTADSTAPTVTMSPVDAATGVATSVAPTWTFNEAVQKNIYAFSLHLLTSVTDTSPVGGTVTFNAGGTVATFTPASALTSGAKYQLVARGVRDLAGNVMAETIGNFTVA
jgi:hypothetical protein